MIKLNDTSPPPDSHDTEPLFFPGQIVRHRRYGYRGVVVDVDATCQADEGWYQSNPTQPDRDQPWYHVLVDGTNRTTYPAQTSLLAEDEPEPVAHPLMEMFFTEFLGDRYVRNERPWPE